MPITIRSHPARVWTSSVQPNCGSITAIETVVDVQKGQSPVYKLNERLGTTPAVKEAAEKYAQAANDRSIKSHRALPTHPSQHEAREQALRFIALRKAGRRRS